MVAEVFGAVACPQLWKVNFSRCCTVINKQYILDCTAVLSVQSEAVVCTFVKRSHCTCGGGSLPLMLVVGGFALCCPSPADPSPHKLIKRCRR